MRPRFQIKGGTALSIAQQIAKPYDVEISSVSGPGANIPQFNVNLGETAWEIIDRITRFSKLVAYDLPDGSVVMAQAGSEKMASGFAQGENAEFAAVTFSADQRYSEYEGHLLSTGVFGNDTGTGATRQGQIVRDEGVKRFRRRYIISEQSHMGQFLAHDRAVWERNRRYGRSQAVQITADAWRDARRQLWAPNHLAPIRFPAIKLPDASWLIASVQYLRDENGQHAKVTMMPVEAFSPEPVALQQTPVLVEHVERFNADRTVSGGDERARATRSPAPAHRNDDSAGQNHRHRRQRADPPGASRGERHPGNPRRRRGDAILRVRRALPGQ